MAAIKIIVAPKRINKMEICGLEVAWNLSNALSTNMIEWSKQDVGQLRRQHVAQLHLRQCPSAQSNIAES